MGTTAMVREMTISSVLPRNQWLLVEISNKRSSSPVVVERDTRIFIHYDRICWPSQLGQMNWAWLQKCLAKFGKYTLSYVEMWHNLCQIRLRNMCKLAWSCSVVVVNLRSNIERQILNQHEVRASRLIDEQTISVVGPT